MSLMLFIIIKSCKNSRDYELKCHSFVVNNNSNDIINNINIINESNNDIIEHLLPYARRLIV